MKWLASHIVSIVFLCGLGIAQQPPALPTADQIVTAMMAKNAERTAHLRSYSSVRHYAIDYRGLPSGKHATMTVRATLENGQKHLEVVDESGSKLLRDRVLRELVENERKADSPEQRLATALGPDNYSFELSGTDVIDGRKCYVLAVTPRRPDRLLYVGRVWIDAEEHALIRIEARPAKNPSFWIKDTLVEHEYGKFGEAWLPMRNHTVSKIRFGGQAVLDIDYGKYEPVEQKRLAVPAD